MASNGLHIQDTVVGLSIDDLVQIEEKLSNMGITTRHLLEFLDRDDIQIKAEFVRDINKLKDRLVKICDLADY